MISMWWISLPLQSILSNHLWLWLWTFTLAPETELGVVETAAGFPYIWVTIITNIAITAITETVEDQKGVGMSRIIAKLHNNTEKTWIKQGFMISKQQKLTETGVTSNSISATAASTFSNVSADIWRYNSSWAAWIPSDGVISAPAEAPIPWRSLNFHTGEQKLVQEY